MEILLCLFSVLLVPETKRYCLCPGLLGSFPRMKGQGILPRLSDLPVKRENFFHMSRPLEIKVPFFIKKGHPAIPLLSFVQFYLEAVSEIKLDKNQKMSSTEIDFFSRA